MNRKSPDLRAAILHPGRQPTATADVHSLPASEMPMVLTLTQLRPNPDNPRTTRNPKYDDIKASIRARGLDTVPKITRDPDGEINTYIFSDGGNTRYQILNELWEETQDERFYRIHVLFKPWPGRLQCVIGHLAENEVRGELTFIEKAQGIHKARALYEEQLQQSVSLRELSSLFNQQGLPIDPSSISRMENTLKYLHPWMPELLESGMGAPQIRHLLSLRQEAEKVWAQYQNGLEIQADFTTVFGKCCQKFNCPELWSLEMFRDELIGDLIQALPHPSLNYDRWLLELDPKENNRRKHFGEPASTVLAPESNNALKKIEAEAPPTTLFPPEKNNEISPVSTPETSQSPSSSEKQTINALPDHADTPLPEALIDSDTDETNDPPSIWQISAHLDDIEHLQNTAFRIAWQLAETLGYSEQILPAKEDALSPGYRASNSPHSGPVAFLLSLNNTNPTKAIPMMFADLFIGGSGQDDHPLLDDESAMTFLRLLRTLRRLRELQRQVIPENRDE